MSFGVLKNWAYLRDFCSAGFADSPEKVSVLEPVGATWSSSRDLITIAECSKIDVFTDKFEHVASSFFGFGWPDGILTQKNRKTCSKTWSTNDLAKLTGNRNLKVQDTCGYFLSILVRQILIKKYNFLSLNHLELVKWALHITWIDVTVVGKHFPGYIL